MLKYKKTTRQHQKLRQLESWDQAVSTGQQGSWKVTINISSLLIYPLIDRIICYSCNTTLQLQSVLYPCFEIWSSRSYEASRFGAQTIAFSQKIFLRDWYSMVWAFRLWNACEVFQHNNRNHPAFVKNFVMSESSQKVIYDRHPLAFQGTKVCISRL